MCWLPCLRLPRLMAQCIPPGSEKLRVSVTKSDLTVWLVNTDDKPVEMEPGELFGFNVGSFTEKGIGAGFML